MAAPRRTLMRWTVASSLRFRYLVVALGALMMAVGIVTLPIEPGRRLPGVRAAAGGHPDRLPGPVHLRRRGAGHRAPGAGAQRRRGPGRHALQVGAAAVVDRADLQARTPTCCTPASWCRSGWRRSPPTLPTWAAPPVMLAPVSATGRAMQIGMTSKDHSLIEMSMTAYWTIRARLLAGARRGQRRDLERAAADDDGAGRARRNAGQHDVSLDQVMEATADAVDSGPAAVLHRLGHRHRRHRRARRTSGSASATCCPSSPRPTWPRCRSSGAAAKSGRSRDARRRGRRSRRTTSR